jgi:hypothetical protein
MRPPCLHWKPVSLESENEAPISMCGFISEKSVTDGFFGMDRRTVVEVEVRPPERFADRLRRKSWSRKDLTVQCGTIYWTQQVR